MFLLREAGEVPEGRRGQGGGGESTPSLLRKAGEVPEGRRGRPHHHPANTPILFTRHSETAPNRQNSIKRHIPTVYFPVTPR